MALFDPWNSVRKSKKEWEKVKWVRKSKIGEKKLLFLTDFTFSHSFCWTTEFDKVTPKVYETNVHFRRKYHLWYKKMTFFHSQWFHSGPGWPHFLTRAPLPSTRALVRKSGARTLVKSVSEKKSLLFFYQRNILLISICVKWWIVTIVLCYTLHMPAPLWCRVRSTFVYFF